MEFFVWGRDRVGGYDIKVRLNEEHWAFMDGYGEQLIARGPTLTGHEDDAETTGSLHIVDLPDEDAVLRFAFEEPYYRAGAFESVELYRFHNRAGRTMWDFTNAVAEFNRYLVITTDASAATPSEHFIVYGDLLTLDGQTPVGQAALLEAPTLEAAATLLPGSPQAHPWEYGGRR
ncbi:MULTISPECIES: YciI family protein [unclassified Kribbella]|uniref:YciI family protein n=1 Tax=unclassified Kribbella TaxID=2644121 RepID=UPI003016E777